MIKKQVREKQAATPEAPVAVEEATERKDGSRSDTSWSGGASSTRDVKNLPPDPRILERAARRRFTAEYKMEVLREADASDEPGHVGEVLRRHGLYSSHLTTWRRERDLGALERLDKKRGRKPLPRNPLAHRVAELERENRRLNRRLRQAETIIDVQKKISEILGIPLKNPESEGDD